MIIAEQHKPTRPDDRRKGAGDRGRKDADKAGADRAGNAGGNSDDTIVEANRRTRQENPRAKSPRDRET